ncbi:MAG: TIGR04376 family protein [Synechococcales bacterium]|nr:TIGR04376 family protein [Synechococcales bacterium]
MGLFEDLSRFLETRLEEFLKNNPHLELQALEEQLREQEVETTRLLASFRIRERQLKEEILATAQEVQRWHVRINKAKAANRWDLVKPAEEREAVLLRQGNQLWGQMKGVKDRIQQTVALHQQIQQRRQEVKARLAAAQAAQKAAHAQEWQTAGWNQTPNYSFSNPSSQATADPLEQTFKRWEMDEDLEQLKREMGRS